MSKKLFARLILALGVAELVLVLLSWVLSVLTTMEVHSLLSSEGVRWFFGSFTDFQATQYLVWLLLIAMAGGCFWKSRMLTKPQDYRDLVALRAALAFLIVYICIMAALTLAPHAILLSAKGYLFPSPFSRALVPVLAFGILLVSVVYGWISGRFSSVLAVIDSMSYGIGKAAPLFLLYVMLIQLYESVKFVF